MKKVKVSIQDEYTLVLQEDASKGDLIDLKSIHEADIDKSSIENVVKSIKNEEFENELNKALEAKEREYDLKLQLKAQEIADNSKDKLVDKDALIAELNAKIESAQLSADLKVKTAVSELEKERAELVVKLDGCQGTEICNTLSLSFVGLSAAA